MLQSCAWSTHLSIYLKIMSLYFPVGFYWNSNQRSLLCLEATLLIMPYIIKNVIPLEKMAGCNY